MSEKRVVGIDDVRRALQIREGGGSWTRVIEETGFNGATLRPHINRYLARTVLGRVTTAEDRVDSPYAVVNPVELTAESIGEARRRGMAYYSIAEALGVSEAKVKGLTPPEYRERQYTPRGGAPTPTAEEVAAEEAAKAEAEAKKAAKAAKAKERRAAKKAAIAAELEARTGVTEEVTAE